MRYLKLFFLLIVVLAMAAGGVLYFYFYKSNTTNQDKKYLYIKSGASYNTVMDSLKNMHVIADMSSFERVATWLQYPSKVKPGRYLIAPKMNNKTLIYNLRAGNQASVNFVLRSNIRTLEQLSGIVANKLDIDSTEFLQILKSDSLMQTLATDSNNIITYFIPNTYQFFWNTSAEKFLKRMESEHDKFWNEERKEKLKRTGLSQSQVYTMASIVEEETNAKADKPIIAGVYINRIKIGMPLQADPTLKFALKDFGIKRVLNTHKLVESPYNTYKYAGLPPGPICIPEISTIDAVLDFSTHEYLYFCAKEDLSGFSNFATNLADHEANAKRYQEALNQRGIYK